MPFRALAGYVIEKSTERGVPKSRTALIGGWKQFDSVFEGGEDRENGGHS